MFRWGDHVGADHVELARAGLDALPPQIPEIRRYVHGPNVGPADTNWDYVVVADFDDLDDFVVYRDHPIHRKFIDELITGHIAERAAVQYEV